MSDDIDSLKQTEKEKMADWDKDFATELDVTQIKAEEETTQVKNQSEAWRTWLPFMLVALGLLAMFGGFNFGFGWWWFFIFLSPWIWGKGGCHRNCWW